MKKIVAFLLIFIIAFSFVGCGKYPSKYFAVGLVTTNTSRSVQMSFFSFEGTRTFTMKCGSDHKLEYSAKLESGNSTVYYDQNGTKTELFSIGAGDEVSSSINLDAGTVYIIIETSEKCQNGSFLFDING